MILEKHEPQAAHLSILKKLGVIFFQVGNLVSARESYQKAIANKRDDQSLALLELKLADIPLQKNSKILVIKPSMKRKAIINYGKNA